MDKSKRITAWAAISKRTGHILRNMSGHYAVYTRESSAEWDCPDYGKVVRVVVRVVKPSARGEHGN